MLEIIALVLLCTGNRKRAIARGKSGGAAVAYTLVLWIGLEIVGMFIAISIFGFTFAVYLIVIGLAVVGGVISYFISKSGTVNALDASSFMALFPSCTVHIYRNDSQIDRDTKYYISLNDKDIGYLENDSMLTVYTDRSRNLITYGLEDKPNQRNSYLFSASSGGTVNIHIEDGMFVKEIAAQKPQDAPVITCPSCGATQSASNAFCVNCGGKL